jgi:chitin disaccharide deacetylase
MAGVASTREARHLVINADDFGLSVGVNRGIAAAVRAGALRSASIMANMPAFDDAVQVAHELGASFGVGLHFNLTLGCPLTPARSLVDERIGTFLPRARLMRRAVLGQVRADDIRAECEAQLKRAADAGLRLTHLDGHHHVHVVPGIAGPVSDCALAAGIRVIRRPDESSMRVWRPWRRVPERLTLAHWSRTAPRVPRAVHHFRGLTLFGSPAFAGGLRATLRSLNVGVTELMVHPGLAHDLPADEPHRAEREIELAALLSLVRTDAFAASGVVLRHHGEIAH